MLSLFPLANAQETKEMKIVGKPKKLDTGEMVARRDGNGNYCAALQMISGMDGFSYDSYDGIVGQIDDNPGKDMVYLTSTERVLEVFKTGYKPLKIILSEYGINLKSREVWQIEIAGDGGADNLPVTFRFTPADAALLIDGKPAGTSTTQNLAVGKHSISLTKDGYQPIEETITVDDKNVFFEWKMEKIQTQWLVINSTPGGADVYLDNKPVGKTPYQNEIQVGKYNWRLTKELYLSDSGMVELLAATKKVQDVQLKPNFGTLNFSSSPAGAAVSLNGTSMNKITPCTIEKVPAGEHTITINLNKYGSSEQKITLNPGETKDIVLQMNPNFGTINLSSSPENGAAVSLNGMSTGKVTPCSVEVPAGESSFTLSFDMYETTTQKITLKAGDTKDLTITMKPTFAVINVISNPPCDIYINTVLKGKSTWQGRLSPGVYTFEGKLDKHTTALIKQTVIVGVPLEIKLTPESITGSLKIMTTPIDASITLNGKDYGTTPTTITNLLIGQYNLALEKTGYGAINKTIEIKENQATEVNETMLSGIEVKIISTPEGAPLSIDGISQGVTPKTLALSFGSHNVKLVNGKKVVEETINIQQGGKSNFIFDVAEFSNFTEKLDNIELEMIAVKGGTFTMGSNEGGDDEKPTHQVTLNDFYIGEYEVTQKQWQDVMGTSTSLSNPSNFSGCDNCPVEQVSWNDVQDFIKKLNQKTGKTYRLPTEAEWEYAAHGGASTGSATATIYSGSNNIDEVAWYYENSGSKTHPVGQKKANELGIYDMSGNVWEWCNDWYGNYSSGSQTNPQGASSGSYRVLRGGSWGGNASYCRASLRYYFPDFGSGNIGFRLALVH